MSTETQPPSSQPAALPDIDEAFREKVNAIYDEWQTNDLPFAAARHQLQNLEKEAIEAGQTVNQGGIYNIIGIMQGYRSRYDESVENFKKARDLFEQAGAKRRIATIDLNLGETYRLIGNYTQARRYFRRAYTEARELENVQLEVTALTNEGQVWLSMNSHEQARETLLKALALSETGWEVEADDEREAVRKADNACEIHVSLVTALLVVGEIEAACEHALKAHELAEFTGRPVRMGFATRSIGDVITVLGKAPDPAFTDDPDDYYNAATAYFKQVKAEGEVAKTLYAQGKSLVKRKKLRSAGRAFQQSMILFTRLGMTTDAAKAAEAQLDTI